MDTATIIYTVLFFPKYLHFFEQIPPKTFWGNCYGSKPLREKFPPRLLTFGVMPVPWRAILVAEKGKGNLRTP